MLQRHKTDLEEIHKDLDKIDELLKKTKRDGDMRPSRLDRPDSDKNTVEPSFFSDNAQHQPEQVGETLDDEPNYTLAPDSAYPTILGDKIKAEYTPDDSHFDDQVVKELREYKDKFMSNGAVGPNLYDGPD